MTILIIGRTSRLEFGSDITAATIAIYTTTTAPTMFLHLSITTLLHFFLPFEGNKRDPCQQLSFEGLLLHGRCYLYPTADCFVAWATHTASLLVRDSHVTELSMLGC